MLRPDTIARLPPHRDKREWKSPASTKNPQGFLQRLQCFSVLPRRQRQIHTVAHRTAQSVIGEVIDLHHHPVGLHIDSKALRESPLVGGRGEVDRFEPLLVDMLTLQFGLAVGEADHHILVEMRFDGGAIRAGCQEGIAVIEQIGMLLAGQGRQGNDAQRNQPADRHGAAGNIDMRAIRQVDILRIGGIEGHHHRSRLGMRAFQQNILDGAAAAEISLRQARPELAGGFEDRS